MALPVASPVQVAALSSSLKKLHIKVLPKGPEFDVLFNPEEYTINKDNNFAVQGIPGLPAPLLQFVNGNLRTLEMELFFDTYDSPSAAKRDVRDLTGQVVKLMDVDPDLHAPPILELSWSSLQLQCVLARVSQKFILFADDGMPVRARLTHHVQRGDRSGTGDQAGAPADLEFQQSACGHAGGDVERNCGPAL